MTDEDLRIIDACLAGEAAAYADLVRRYQDRLFHAMSCLVAPEDAQDVVQEALVQAYLKLATFQRSSAFYTWLYRIAFNVAMTQRRKKRPTATIDESREAGLPDPIDDGAAPSARLEQLERARQVQLCLAALSDEHRTILVMKDVDDLRYEEIAETLEIPIGTVRSRLFRARMQLKEKLKEVLQEDTQT